MICKIYDYKLPGLFPIPAQTAGEHLEEVKEKNGALTRENVLDSGRPEESPIHPCFEWDNEKAGEEYRLIQANRLIRSVVVVRQDEEDEKHTAPAFVNVSVARTGSYISTEKALSQDDTRAIVLSNAIRELQCFQRKYQSLTELADVFRAIEGLGEEI